MSCEAFFRQLFWNSLALWSAFSIVCSSSAASSRLDDKDDTLDCRGEEDRNESERGGESLGVDMGKLMMGFLGGEDEGLMLSDEPKRARFSLVVSFVLSLEEPIQEIFSGMLLCRTVGTLRRAPKRGGGGRGGGDDENAPSF